MSDHKVGCKPKLVAARKMRLFAVIGLVSAVLIAHLLAA